MILKGVIAAMLVAGSVSLCVAATPAELVKEGKVDEAIAAYRGAIHSAPDTKAKGTLHKELGDLFASRDDYPNAAAEYIEALTLFRGFTETERMQMTVAISWGDRLPEAMAETRSILADHPENTKARVHLARFLSWSGDLDGAIVESERVLKVEPDNRDALLVKANALSWQGNQRAAIPIYRDLLAQEDNFDVRLGLANTLLASGNYREAEQTGGQLQPVYPYQERETKKFRNALAAATRTELDLRYSYYDDTDHNQVNRYLAGLGFWLGNLRLGLNYRHTAAHDLERHNRAEDGGVRVYTQLMDWLGAGAALGLTQESGTSDHLFVTGQLLANFEIPNGTVGVVLGEEAFTDTAQLIENGIRYETAIVTASQRVTERLSLLGRYAYREYSDHNHAHDVQISPVYTLLTGNPHLRVGYRFRYLNFERQSRSGYFDPNDFMSHQIFVACSAETGRLYGYLEPYGGLQSFRRNGVRSNDDLFGGVSGTVGYRVTNNLRAEFNGEFGNYALQTAAGFEYYQIGGRLLISF